MALAFTTVADSISKLSVSGVTIQDLDSIPGEVLARDCPMIIPAPNYITDFKPERVSFGSGGTAKIEASYTLNYRLLAAEAGDMRGLHEIYPVIVAKIGLFLDALITNDAVTGAVDIEAANISSFGAVTDPSDKVFHGCDIAIRVLEFVN